MKLTLIANHNLDELENLAIQYFSNLNSEIVEVPVVNANITAFPIQNLGKLVYYKPIHEMKELSIIFAFPKYYEGSKHSLPLYYISYFLQHKGYKLLLSEHSLYQNLKKDKLIAGIV